MARNILQNSACVSLVDDQLVLSKTKYAMAFNQLVKAGLSHWESQSNETFVDVLRVEAPGDAHLGFLLRTIPVSNWYQSDTSPSIIIYLNDLEVHQQAPEQFIARLFGLTPSEALLATLLADGLTLAEVASKLKLTEGSVRTTSKRVYAKTGVNRQAGLVRLILKSVALLAGTGQPYKARPGDKEAS